MAMITKPRITKRPIIETPTIKARRTRKTRRARSRPRRSSTCRSAPQRTAWSARSTSSAPWLAEKSFQPGLLAQANRGFLIDEVNLLSHLVDFLLDVAACGVNVVEREGLSIRHPAHFVLIGSGNPEEGELRPQFSTVWASRWRSAPLSDVPMQIEVVKRRDAFERDTGAPLKKWAGEEESAQARRIGPRPASSVATPDSAMGGATRLCLALGVGWSPRRIDPGSSRARARQPRGKRGGRRTRNLRRIAPMALA